MFIYSSKPPPEATELCRKFIYRKIRYYTHRTYVYPYNNHPQKHEEQKTSRKKALIFLKLQLQDYDYVMKPHTVNNVNCLLLH